MATEVKEKEILKTELTLKELKDLGIEVEEVETDATEKPEDHDEKEATDGTTKSEDI